MVWSFIIRCVGCYTVVRLVGCPVALYVVVTLWFPDYNCCLIVGIRNMYMLVP
jgi:hypothetical protein